MRDLPQESGGRGGAKKSLELRVDRTLLRHLRKAKPVELQEYAGWIEGRMLQRAASGGRTGFHALRELYSRTHPVPRAIDPGESARPIAVNVILATGADARPVLQGDGVRLHLSDGNGHQS